MKTFYTEPEAEILEINATIITSLNSSIEGELGPDTLEKDAGDVGSWND